MKKFRRFRRALIAFLLSLITVLPMVACEEGSVGYATVDDVEFWRTYAAESILQDLHGVYDDFKFEPKIDLTVIGGEEEADKIIMTTGDKPIKEFYAEITDLKSGDNVISKDDIGVYQVLYTYVGSKEFYKYEGYYPDGLAPMAGTKLVKENTVAANSNQGIYVSFNIPIDQPAGIYTGTLAITIGDGVKNVPVTITVVDASLTEETHFMTSISLGWGPERGELDTTFAMRQEYIDVLKSHRMGPNVVLTQYNHDTNEEVETFVNFAIQYCRQPDAVSYGVPALNSTSVESYTIVYSDGKEVTLPTEEEKAAGTTKVSIYSPNNIKKYYGGLFYGALEWYMETGEEVDVFAKAFSKGIDEPDLRNATGNMYKYSYSFTAGRNAVIAEILADESIPQEVKESDFFQTLHDSLMKVPHIVTSWTPQKLYSEGGPFDPLVMDMTFCPHYNESGSSLYRDQFRSVSMTGTMWWYGCDTPKAPYPSYHLGNHALAMRIAGWMAADYDIAGNLVWSSNLYNSSNGDGTDYMEDYYDQSVRSRSIPGEGFLFYPGKYYGVYGPIPTMRIKQFKDGIEEWEMIYRLKEIYASKGYDEHKIMETLYKTMYDTARIYDTISCKIVESARETLINLLLLAESDAQVLITNFSDVRGSVFYDVFVADGYTLGSDATDDVKVSDKFVVTETKVEGGTLYNIECKEEDAVTISYKEEDGDVKSVSFGLDLGAATFTPATQLYNKGSIKPDDKTGPAETLEFALVNGTDINATEEMANLQYVQLLMGDAAPLVTGAPGQQSFIIQDALVSAIKDDVNKLQIELYYTGDEEIPVQFTYKGKRSIAAGVTSTLTKGMNRITIEGMKSLAWNNIGTLEFLLVRYGNTGALANDDVYFVGLTVYR